MKEFTIEIDCPEGYRPVAFRLPKATDFYVNKEGGVFKCGCRGRETDGPRLIVEKIKPVERVFRLVAEDEKVKEWQYISYKEKGLQHLRYCDDDDNTFTYGMIWEEVTNESK